MFDHVKIGVTDYAASKAFFLTALAPLGVVAGGEGEPTYGIELCGRNDASLCLFQAKDRPAALHIAFVAESRDEVDAFYAAALAAGGMDNGAPGLRPQYHASYYAAFVIGPDGHNIEAVCHAGNRKHVARSIVFTTQAAKPPPTYSQAVKAAGLVFVSGTAPVDPATGAIAGATIQEQTRQCLANIRAILEAAGSSLDKLVSVTVVLADEDDFAGMNEEWLRWFPSDPPARQGAKLPARIPGLKVSIAAIAEA
jgi:2-iminobutanoate/2-iminopropanoate deaminase